MLLGWFRKSFSSLLAKADKAREQEDFAKAIEFFEEALARIEEEGVDEEKEQVQQSLAKTKDLLAEERLDDALQFLEEGLLEEAEELAELAKQDAQSQEIQKKAEHVLAQIRPKEESEAHDTLPSEIASVDQEDSATIQAEVELITPLDQNELSHHESVAPNAKKIDETTTIIAKKPRQTAKKSPAPPPLPSSSEDVDSGNQDTKDRFTLYVESASPILGEAYRMLGSAFQEAVILLHEGQVREALSRLEKIEPSIPVQRERGIAKSALGDLEGAIEDLEEVLLAFPEDITARVSVAEALVARAFSMNPPPPSLSPKAHKEEPSIPALRKEQIQDIEQSILHLREALRREPNEEAHYLALVDIHLAIRSIKNARRTVKVGLERLLPNTSGSSSEYERRPKSSWLPGYLPPAMLGPLSAYEQRLSIGEEGFRLLVATGKVEAAAKSWDRAEQALQRALDFVLPDPPSPLAKKAKKEAMEILARILLERGRAFEKALQLVNTLLKSEENPIQKTVLLIQQGEILTSLSRQEEAKKAFLEAQHNASAGSHEAVRIEALLKELNFSSRNA